MSNKIVGKKTKIIKEIQLDKEIQFKVRFHFQNDYLVTKIKKDGKLYNISSGIKIPDSYIWVQDDQELVGVSFWKVREPYAEFSRLKAKILDAKKDIYKRIETFKLTGNPEALKKRKVSPAKEIKTVAEAITAYKNATSKNASIVTCLEYQLSNYRKTKKIEGFNIQDFYNYLKIKVSSKNTYITVLNMILKKTVGKDSIIERERKDVRSPRILDQETINLIETSDHKHSHIIRLLLYTGIRSGELPVLVKAYRKNPKLDSVKYIMPKTKTERIIPLTNKIKREISLMKKVPKYNTIWKYFHDTYKTNLHVLRATFITKAHRRKIPSEIISKAVGHSNVNTTIQFYTRFLDEEIFTAFD